MLNLVKFKNENMHWVSYIKFSLLNSLLSLRGFLPFPLVNQQFLQFKTKLYHLLQKNISFNISDSYCLAVVTNNDYLYLYKYSNIGGWLQLVYGFFKGIESIMPFNHMNKMYLFVSMKNSATVISVYSQGLHW